MLACARIGAVHSVVFGGFAAPELATRIDDARPKVIVSASCGIEVSRVIEYKPILDRAIELASHKPEHCVVLQRPEATAALTAGRDLDWEDAARQAEPADCVPVAATDPLYILYTSGTTARPKGVVRDNGGHAVALRWSMEHIYDTEPGEVFWAASDVGWVVGHSYIVYAPLLAEPMPTRAGSPTMPVPGYDVRILGADGTEAKPGDTGDIVVRLPLPPGCLPTLWQDDERFVASYLSAHPGCYTTGDGGYRDEDGYVYVMGRIDDVINVAGHRLSTGQMEEVLASHPAVAECAVIGVQDETKGQVPRGFVVLKAGVVTEPAVVSAELVQLVRERIGAVAALRRVDVVTALPKTRSGKILRKTMRGIADGVDEPVPSTIEDPAVLDALRPVLSGD
jgi:propionyl-CoA synthetase